MQNGQAEDAKGAASRAPSRLALRIAALVAGVVGLAALLLHALALPAPVEAVLVAAAAALAAYAAVRARVARRLDVAREALRAARKRRFEGLDQLESVGARDELDALVYQAYRAGRALQEEIERLERVEDYRREFLGDVSHELRTPIFAVSGFAESLLDGALDDDRVRRRFVEKIAANARRLDALTRDLAEIARIETGELQMRPEPFDLRSLVHETLDALEPLATERRVALEMDVAAGFPPVLGDRARLQQVLANLVENGVKYNEPGGRVLVTARREEGGPLRVTVEDDGIGIPPEEVPRLTERFFRVDKSRSREQGGTGLGLAIVKHILEAHGQRLHVESRVGEGSTFEFTLPTAERAAERAAGVGRG